MNKVSGIKQGIKKILKEKLIAREQNQYNRLIEQTAVMYDTWIRKQESILKKELEKADSGLSIRRVFYEDCKDYLTQQDIRQETADIVLFMGGNGRESELAEPLLLDFLQANRDIDIVYGDEDVLSPAGIRYTPWLKPDWSPDTFLSNFYLGSVFAVRTAVLQKLSEEERQSFWEKEDENYCGGIYRMCHALIKKCGGFERRKKSEGLGGFPIGHIPEILFHSFSNREMELLFGKDILSGGEDKTLSQETEAVERVAVSFIIPSKNNEVTLKRCIESVIASLNITYEIIVVDNGSTAHIREGLSDYLAKRGMKYLYKEMPFNFSLMCNMGAKEASGQVLIFLNDDVKVPAESAGALERLYSQAVKPYAGAVGAKLLYPDTDMIQHAGIVNIRLGPVHKLQFHKNNACYYQAWNSGTRNVLAVTGACLAVERSKFIGVGGFPQELPVAFNDVDLCFSLFEEGFYNVVMQEVILYHYESLSRGQDEGKDKLKRLTGERENLYRRHKELYGKDPFFHKYMAGDILSTDFDLKSDYEWKEDMPYARFKKCKGIAEKGREEPCVISSIEYAGTWEKWKNGNTGGDCYIQGYVFVSGSNNACYKIKILLQDETNRENIFVIVPERLIRRDVERNLADQSNVALSGFAARIKEQKLPEGNYRVGMMAKDKCSGQILYQWTNKYLGI